GLSRILRMESRWKTAKRFAARALELDPNNPDAALNALISAKSPEEKLKMYERYLELKPVDSADRLSAIRARVEVLRRLGGKETFVLEGEPGKIRVPLAGVYPTP